MNKADSAPTVEQQIDALGRLADDWHHKAKDKPKQSMAYKAHIEYRDACNAAITTIEQLQQERDKYKKALEGIVERTPANEHKVWPHHHHYLFVANEALKAGQSNESR